MVKILYTTRIKVVSVDGYVVKIPEEYKYLTVDNDGNIWIWKEGMFGRRFVERMNNFNEDMIGKVYSLY